MCLGTEKKKISICVKIALSIRHSLEEDGMCKAIRVEKNRHVILEIRKSGCCRLFFFCVVCSSDWPLSPQQ